MSARPAYEELQRRVDELEARLGSYQKRFAGIRRYVSEFVFEHDLEGNFTEVIPHDTGRLGLTREGIVGKNIRDLIPKRFRGQFDDYLKRVVDSGRDEGLFQVVPGSGRVHIIEYRNILVTDGTGAKTVQGIARDVTERMETERALIESDTRSRVILDSIEDGYFEVDREGRFIFFNRRIPEHLGYTEDEMEGMSYRQLMDEESARYVFSMFYRIFTTGEPVRSMEWELMKKDGTRVFVDTSVSLRKDRRGEVIGFQGIIRDVTDRKRFEQELAYLAYHDSLTGLFNRKAFLERLTETVMEARRHETMRAVLYLDLDSFKKVNDLYGHEVGDRLLIEVAARLRGALREGDCIGRLGGDEFTVILAGPKTPHAERVAARIIERLSRPYRVLGVTIDFVSASVGVSVFPEDGHDARTLLKHADEAMYRAKHHKGCFVRYGTAGGIRTRRRVAGKPRGRSGRAAVRP